MSRFKGHPERVQNIYFNYALLTRAVSKLKNYLNNYTFCSGDYYQNRLTKSKVMKLASAASYGPPIFDESLMFKNEMLSLKEEFRNRFRNVSRLMDCVGCDKCRLWGKVQTQGYGTALKVLFEFNENGENPVLRRTELVALINTLDRVSHSLLALDQFKDMWDARNGAEVKAAGDEKKREQQEKKQEKKKQEKKKQEKKQENVEEEEEEELTVIQMFWEEWYLVWRTFAFVIRSWYELPMRL